MSDFAIINDEAISRTLDFNEVNIPVKDILRLLGTNESDVFTLELIDKYLKKTADLIEINTGMLLVKSIYFEKQDYSVILEDRDGIKNQFLIDKIIFNQLKKSEKIIVFICTAGEKISDLSKKLMTEGDLLSGYIVDVIGSVSVEAAMDVIQNDIENQMHNSGLKITNRFSPGYCNWNVSEQQKLFQFFPKGFCGIELLPSSLMKPSKSISGFIGVGKDVKRSSYSCNVCNRTDCIYRRQQNTNL